MSKLSTKLTGVATLALAAIPMLALSTAAHAGPMSVTVGDLSSPAAVAAFEQRLNRTAKALCAPQTQGVGPRLVSTTACRQAVRAEAMDNLSAAQRTRIAANGRSELAAR